MKRFVFGLLAVLVVAFAGVCFGQDYPVQTPVVTMAGDFNNGTGDTSLKGWAANAARTITGSSIFPNFYTRLDTLRNGNAYNDSVHVRLVGAYRSVTLEAHVTLDSGGTNCDSVTVGFWATSTYGNGQGSYRLLQAVNTLTATNGTEQVFIVVANAGVGNPYTNYRITYDVLDAVNTCRVSERSYLTVR